MAGLRILVPHLLMLKNSLHWFPYLNSLENDNSTSHQTVWRKKHMGSACPTAGTQQEWLDLERHCGAVVENTTQLHSGHPWEII